MTTSLTIIDSLVKPDSKSNPSLRLQKRTLLPLDHLSCEEVQLCLRSCLNKRRYLTFFVYFTVIADDAVMCSVVANRKITEKKQKLKICSCLRTSYDDLPPQAIYLYVEFEPRGFIKIRGAMQLPCTNIQTSSEGFKSP